MNKAEKQFRYPGTRPFTEDDRLLFFGRDEDIEQLYRKIKLEKLVVMFGKSGLGKSSLLNAGIVPRLKEQNNFLAISVRFGIEGSERLTPNVIFLRKLTQSVRYDNLLWDKLVPDSKTSWESTDNDECFWLGCKSLQIQDPLQPVIFVLDQFEELFSADQKEVERFAFLISTLLYGQTPQTIKDLALEKLKTDRTFFTKEETDLLFEPLNIKIVISIRSDKLSLLNRLKTSIPQVLQKTYELQPLNLNQALDALLKPASAEGDFISPVFEYDKRARDEIINYLSSEGKKHIEAFQLQLICQFCENLIIKQVSLSKIKNLGKVMAVDLGDLSTIFERHYNKLINEIPDGVHQLATRRLIEEDMIINGIRVPIPELVITRDRKIPPIVLQMLVNSRLLRCEPNTTGGLSYEISHDTLIEPITKSFNLRHAEEEKVRIEAERQEELRKAMDKAEKERIEREKEVKRQRKIIIIISIAAGICFLFAVLAYRLYLIVDMERNKTLSTLDQVEDEKMKAEEALKKFQAQKIKELINDVDIYLVNGKNQYAIETLLRAWELDSTDQQIKLRMDKLNMKSKYKNHSDE